MGDVSVAVSGSQDLSISSGIQYPIGNKSNINETAHGLAVGEVVTYKSGAWTTYTTGDTPIGVVVKVIDANNITILTSGFTDLLTGLTANTLYYAQSDGTLGTTVTEAPIFYAVSTTEGFIISQKTTTDTATNLKAYLLDSTIRTITDGATPAIDCESWGQRIFKWSTAESTPTLSLSNLGKGVHLMIKKTIAGDTTVTLSGSGYDFVDMDSDNDTVAGTVDITLSGGANSYYEISIFDSGDTDSGTGDNILLVTSNL